MGHITGVQFIFLHKLNSQPSLSSASGDICHFLISETEPYHVNACLWQPTGSVTLIHGYHT